MTRFLMGVRGQTVDFEQAILSAIALATKLTPSETESQVPLESNWIWWLSPSLQLKLRVGNITNSHSIARTANVAGRQITSLMPLSVSGSIRSLVLKPNPIIRVESGGPLLNSKISTLTHWRTQRRMMMMIFNSQCYVIVSIYGGSV